MAIECFADASKNLSQKSRADALHDLAAILVRPLVGYIISNINLLAVTLRLTRLIGNLLQLISR